MVTPYTKEKKAQATNISLPILFLPMKTENYENKGAFYCLHDNARAKRHAKNPINLLCNIIF